MRLKYWPGNEVLKGESLEVKEWDASGNATLFMDFQDFTKGLMVEGVSGFPLSLLIQADNMSYVLNADGAGRMNVERFAFLGGFVDEIVSVDRECRHQNSGKFRLLLRRGMLEFYLNDEFMECCNLRCPDARNVRVGIRKEKAEQRLIDIAAWTMSLE